MCGAPERCMHRSARNQQTRLERGLGRVALGKAQLQQRATQIALGRLDVLRDVSVAADLIRHPPYAGPRIERCAS